MTGVLVSVKTVCEFLQFMCVLHQKNVPQVALRLLWLEPIPTHKGRGRLVQGNF